MHRNLSVRRYAHSSLVLLLLATPPSASAQRAASDPQAATVTGIVYDHASAEPAVGVRVFLVGTPHESITDDMGWFRIDAPVSGRHEVAVSHPQLNALGIAPPRIEVVLEPGRAAKLGISLPVALRAAALARECADPRRPGGIVAGAVLEPDSDVGLPGVRVRLAWRDADGKERSMAVRTRSDGSYLACGLPVGERIHVRARSMGGPGEAGTSLTLGEEGLALRDLRLTERAAAVSVAGVLHDRESGTPISAAVVRMPALGRQAVTDASGRFELREVVAGSHDLEIEHLAYGVRRERVRVTEEPRQFLQLRVPMEAIPLEGIRVVARSAAEEYRRRSGTQVHLFTRRDIEAREAVARNAIEVIQGRIPGMIVQRKRVPTSWDDDDFGPPNGILCIMSMRRPITPTSDPSRPCVTVIVDGRRLGMVGGAVYLEFNLLPEQIESIEFIPPIQAGFRYGPDARNGAVEIWTRGQGPWAERGRP